jgi:hypothetical protein
MNLPKFVRLPVTLNRSEDWQLNYAGVVGIGGTPVSIQVWLNLDEPGSPLTLKVSVSQTKPRSLIAS